MRRSLTLTLALAVASGSAVAQQCSTGWSGRFGTQVFGAPAGYGPWVSAQCVFDDGTGPALIVGGFFDRAGSAAANSIVQWDGSTFHLLDTGITSAGAIGWIPTMATFNPPGSTRPLLFVGGGFDRAGAVQARNLAAWDGDHWFAVPGTPVSGGLPETDYISNLVVADPDGDGPMGLSLVVTVTFINGGLNAYSSSLWAWDGSAWTMLTVPGGSDEVSSTAAWASGVATGLNPQMYFTTRFGFSTHCYETSSTGLSRLGPSGPQSILWGTCNQYCGQPSCSEVPFFFQTIAFDPDAQGPAPSSLVLRGSFNSVLGAPAHNLAAFDGVSWSQFAGGADGLSNLFSLTDPTTLRPSLYATGNNFTVGGIQALNLARYDSTGWTPIPFGLTGAPTSMVPFTPPGALPSIYVGGVSNTGVPVPGWSRLTQYGWAPIGQCLNNEVHALATYAPPGQTESLYAGGTFTTAAGQLAVSFARWDGAAWSPAVNLNNHVDCMARFGPYLALGGKFTYSGLPSGGVGLFDGSSVIPLGTGMNTPVHALASFGGQLYAGGSFTIAGGTSAVGIARWNGSSWSPLGSGTNNHVDALAVYDDGAGPALYAGGKFSLAGGQPAPHLARWTGSAWSPIAAGGADGNIEALTVMDDGSGPALYLGGDFTTIGGITASRLARYLNGSFTALASSIDGTVRALSALDPDGASPLPEVLVAGGDFTHIDGSAAAHAAIWNGIGWEPLSLSAAVLALAPFDAPGAAPAMYFGGPFTTAGAAPTTFIADFTRCACYANCDGSAAAPVLNVNDFVCFLNHFAAASPTANCDRSTTPPTLNVGDFTCFLNAFAAGCP